MNNQTIALSKQANVLRHIAAIDMGSNSFHLVIARVIGTSLQIIFRHKQRVQLAAGLDSHCNLDQDAMQRGLDCLRIFADRLQNFPACNVRTAATYTLRKAQNANIFLKRAAKIFPYPIEVIPGTEEARLIYLGVAHTQPNEGKKLVIDIGGGSTELVLGKDFETHYLSSKHMGCVSYAQAFFPNGKITAENMQRAQWQVAQKLKNITHVYQQHGWDTAIGSSGTIKTVREVLFHQGHHDGLLTQDRLKTLCEQTCLLGHADKLNFDGLTADRRPLFAAGLVILYGIMVSFNIKSLQYSDGALREGLLYEMETRFRFSDVRQRTAQMLAEQYHVDTAHAKRIRETAEMIFSQVVTTSAIKKTDLMVLLKWGALLHEVGLGISYSGYHRHSSYLLEHSSMPGFNQEEQRILACLVRFHRKALKLEEMPQLILYKNKQLYPLIRTLRLAVILHSQRHHNKLESFSINAEKEHWVLHLPTEWQNDHPLRMVDLAQEQVYWHKVGWELELTFHA